MAIIGTNDTATVRVASLPSGAAFDSAANVTFSPAGGLASDNVQEAIVEVAATQMLTYADRSSLASASVPLSAKNIYLKSYSASSNPSLGSHYMREATLSEYNAAPASARATSNSGARYWINNDYIVKQSSFSSLSEAQKFSALYARPLLQDDISKIWLKTLAISDDACAAASTLASDGHSNWVRLQSGINYNPIELVIYGSQGQGFASCEIGGNTVTRIEGTEFSADWVGKVYFYFNGSQYKVSAVADANTLTVQTVAGGSVSFPSTVSSATYHYVVTSGDGICDVSGTTVTRITGQPFIPFGNSIIINGTEYSYTFIDPDTIALGSSGGTQSGVSYRYETNINNQISTIRVQKLFGTSEENMSIWSSALGSYHINSLVSGSGSHYPIKIGSGAYSSGQIRSQIVLQKNGDLSLGGDYATDSLRIAAGAEGVAYNPLIILPAASGFGPTMTARSETGDTNVGMNFDALGSGNFSFSSNAFGSTVFQILGSTTATSWLSASGDASGAPMIASNGAAADIDIKLDPKGSGLVWLGGPVSLVTTETVVAYMLAKDGAGNIIKVACMA